MFSLKSLQRIARPVTARYFSAEVAATEMQKATYENIIVEKKDGNVAQITLNRPKALNALCIALFNDLHKALKELD
jgi:1,4-dihydroxy-2-naphthoyl-CoA synthase